jgi:hypothetical protein
MTKCPVLPNPTGFPSPHAYQAKNIMEAERINLIGTTLHDLRERTVDLRRYL